MSSLRGSETKQKCNNAVCICEKTGFCTCLFHVQSFAHYNAYGRAVYYGDVVQYRTRYKIAFWRCRRVEVYWFREGQSVQGRWVVEAMTMAIVNAGFSAVNHM